MERLRTAFFTLPFARGDAFRVTFLALTFLAAFFVAAMSLSKLSRLERMQGAPTL